MRCEEIQELLDLRLADELPEEMARRVERHLLRCPTCAYEAQSLAQTRRMLQEEIPAAELSPAFRERAAARLQDAFADRMRPVASPDSARQWALPFHQE